MPKIEMENPKSKEQYHKNESVDSTFNLKRIHSFILLRHTQLNYSVVILANVLVKTKV